MNANESVSGFNESPNLSLIDLLGDGCEAKSVRKSKPSASGHISLEKN